GPFWMHVTAVYNTTLQESGYIDSAFCYGYAIGIIEYVNQVYKSYPNPFTNSTTIKFALDGNSNIEFSIFNSIGEMVHKFEETYDQGTHQVTWSPHHLPAGLYYAVLRSEDGVSVVKMVKQ
ncbi:MAG TPA: T9SS type A sorting domain-containing protein, partial [Bacteroidales bacterium]|nr:T9SS type A sorting domain-containing protein [Bacteroidales bacterium]